LGGELLLRKEMAAETEGDMGQAGPEGEESGYKIRS